MLPRLSVIVATIGRETLPRALQSVADQPLHDGDEVLVVGGTREVELTARRFGYRFVRRERGNNYGHAERQHAMSLATGTHLLFLDDDDVFLPGAFSAIRASIEANPGRPLMFKMIAPGGLLLWREPVVREGNHGTPQFVVPNDPQRLGEWGSRYQGDFDFCTSTLARYPDGSLVWDAAIIYECRPQAGSVGTSDEMERPRRTRAYEAVHDRLVTAARERSRMFHAEVRGILSSFTVDSNEPPAVDDILRQIAEDEHRSSRPLLTALVVTGKAIPGNIFFTSARDLGLLASTDPAEEMRFWMAEEARVYDRWARSAAATSPSLEESAT